MRHSAPPRVLAVALLLLGAGAASAQAGGTGGAAAPQPVSASEAGGVGFSTIPPGARPVAHLNLALAAARPVLRVRFTEPGAKSVSATVVVQRRPGNATVARISLGKVTVGRSVTIPWPARVSLAAGRYLVRVHASDADGHQLLRAGKAPGRLAFRVPAVVRPKPAPAPAPTPAPTSRGVFPVAGSYSYGDPFGAPRSGYSHQGQDIAAGEGTPIVAPLGGTISTTGYQASAAGYYVVLNATDGHAYFFAHCQKGTTAVSPGSAVSTGAPICRVGHTGDATGPHLHFEEWVGGWRVSTASHPVDPLPQLRAWAK